MLKFLAADDVKRIHDRILAVEPGRDGTHDERLEAVVGRVKNAYVYGEIDDVFNLAAYYAVAIAKGHPFVDCNKRTAFTTCITILEVNGMPVPEVVKDRDESWADIMVMVASGQVDQKQLANVITSAYVIGAIGVGVFKLAEWLADKMK